MPIENRRFIKNKDELELTKIVKIMPRKCNENQTISVYIESKTNSFERRQLLRGNWISDFRSRNISVYFAIALTFNQNEQKLIEKESEKYGDLIQFGFIESYYNLTLKSIAILRWSEKYCKTKDILKADDDLVINFKIFMKNIEKLEPGD